ncbi:hypothetical protein NZK27_03910 [Synechococcus sp. FGCU-3]|nr:hypothetical protein [Synechococcus sp. FGCU3]
MAWDPTVLRKYNTTGHFRLLNQLRGELKDHPLVRPKQGETVGDANRSKALTRILEGRGAGGGRSRRVAAVVEAPAPEPIATNDPAFDGFRDRLNAVELR